MAESRTIYKVKRFLSTLVQFGTDISPDTGDRVKELIFNLVVSFYSTLLCNICKLYVCNPDLVCPIINIAMLHLIAISLDSFIFCSPTK